MNGRSRGHGAPAKRRLGNAAYTPVKGVAYLHTFVLGPRSAGETGAGRKRGARNEDVSEMNLRPRKLVFLVK